MLLLKSMEELLILEKIIQFLSVFLVVTYNVHGKCDYMRFLSLWQIFISEIPWFDETYCMPQGKLKNNVKYKLVRAILQQYWCCFYWQPHLAGFEIFFVSNERLMALWLAWFHEMTLHSSEIKTNYPIIWTDLGQICEDFWHSKSTLDDLCVF